MLYKYIERLSGIPGVSGNEEQVRYEILRMIEGKCLYKVDALGNILAFKKGRETPKQKLMISAHMDEVGLIVTYIEDDGLLRFTTVGGIDKRTIPGKSVLIGETFGVIGMKAMHMKSAEEREKAADLDTMYLDIGAKDRDEARKLVHLGDRAVFCSQYAEFGDGFLRGRALDNRVGCALAAALIESDLPYDCHFAFTVQEETGTTGGKTAAAQIAPEIAIVLETTTACDIPDTPPTKVVCALKKGPVLSFMDRGTIYDRDLYRRALTIAAEKGIACQPKAGVYGGNEARSVQVAGEGAKVLAVSVPCRYLHTPSCVVNRFDVDETRKLLPELIGAFGR
ncbi:M42 family metallopeptidase [Anaerotruncus rubiinfantis]|uniref:M42 family metallopeptidase n=1 Tax=Anaerotruncus rubiinfantis TaxID=1720200 RepID=UPI0008362AAF|nr:M42 family peptidase [Anaerotruncus rubiinfantis]